ncbi:hypothetical protein D3C73_929270 [compost metagenome]
MDACDFVIVSNHGIAGNHPFTERFNEDFQRIFMLLHRDNAVNHYIRECDTVVGKLLQRLLHMRIHRVFELSAAVDSILTGNHMQWFRTVAAEP